jgi:hypothetical protein
MTLTFRAPIAPVSDAEMAQGGVKGNWGRLLFYSPNWRGLLQQLLERVPVGEGLGAGEVVADVGECRSEIVPDERVGAILVAELPEKAIRIASEQI